MPLSRMEEVSIAALTFYLVECQMVIAVGVMSESDGRRRSSQRAVVTAALSMVMGTIQQIKRVKMRHDDNIGLMSVPHRCTCTYRSGFEEV